jgi:hypothetical protein
MKKLLIVLYSAVFCLVQSIDSYSQGVAISSSGTSNDPSAILEISCTDQGVLLPRMTELERDAIMSPAEGLFLYNTTTNSFNVFNGTAWKEVQSTFVTSSSGTVSPGKGIAINSTGAPAHNSAMLDISSATKGVLLPRLASASVTSPAEGLLIYNSINKDLSFYDGSSWISPCALSVKVSSTSGSAGIDGIAINATGALADQSAILDISSSDKGLRLPRLTDADRNDLLPTAGLLIYNVDSGLPQYWNGSAWFSLPLSSGNGFITKWRTTAPNESITLPLNDGNGSSFNCTVYWGDGSSSTITAHDDPDITHSYAVADDYEVEIVGTCEGWRFIVDGNHLKIIDIINWGDPCVFSGFKYLTNGFTNCENLQSLASGSIPASGTGCTDFSSTFGRCIALTSIPAGLFDEHTQVSANGFHYTFGYCPAITSIPAGLFDNNLLVSVSGFQQTFAGCSSLTSIPAGLFDNNPQVNSFNFTFYQCSSLTSIPGGLFDNNTMVTGNAFENTFGQCSALNSIPAGLFDHTTQVTMFYNTFAHCTSLTSIPAGLFDYTTQLGMWGFAQTFYNCTSLSSIPAGLFDYNTSLSHGAFHRTFWNCSALASIPANLFDNNPLLSDWGFYGTFYGCSSITSIPAGLFDNNINLAEQGFYETFQGCTSLTSIPSGLFDYNILVSAFGFESTFEGCTSLTSIPSGLFDNNTLVSTNGFYATFMGCTSLETVPANLLRNNTLVSGFGFYRTFKDCPRLQLNRNIFFADGEELTRFQDKTVNFQECFARDSFTGNLGEAPPLWTCTTGTLTGTNCYDGAGNSASSLSNYASIPAGWK